MAKPQSRAEFKEYCLRQLGAPVLEINIATEQCEDIIDDAIQFFHERHFDGVAQVYLNYKVTQDDIDRGKGAGQDGVSGITTTSASTTINGQSIQFDYEENSNYLEIPPEIIGVTKLWRFDGTNIATNNMFSLKYQLWLNDIAFNWGTTELLSYAMTRTYLSDIDFLLNTEKQIRFNQRMDRLYIDIDWEGMTVGDFFVIDCWRALDPADYARVWNDSFLKPYTVALMKRQWGQNLLKFTGVKLPGGVELNGRQIYDDAEKDLERIRERMSETYELPPLDMIG